MTKWLKPDKEIIKHGLTVIHFNYEYDDEFDGPSRKDYVDIFKFEGIGNTFISANGHKIKYNKIIEWFPVPEYKISDHKGE